MAEVLGRYSSCGPIRQRWQRAQEAASEQRLAGVLAWQPHALTKRLGSEKIAAIAAEYVAGDGCTVLAQRYGVSENAVLAQLRRSGVVLRARGKVTVEDVAEMRWLRQAGWTYQAIGEKFGVTRVAVKRRLDRR